MNFSDKVFITASADGTLKYWMIARAGVTKQYIPNFDRADTRAQLVMASDETALSVGTGVGSRSVLSADHSSLMIGGDDDGNDVIYCMIFSCKIP